MVRFGSVLVANPAQLIQHFDIGAVLSVNPCPQGPAVIDGNGTSSWRRFRWRSFIFAHCPYTSVIRSSCCPVPGLWLGDDFVREASQSRSNLNQFIGHQDLLVGAQQGVTK